MQTLDHPQILKLYEYFEDEKNVYLITELCEGGELFEKIIEKEFFDEQYAAYIFKQILQGVNYCHQNDIVHRDLKPENFLFETTDDKSHVKIIDFGLSKMVHQDKQKGKGKGKVQRMQTRAGTPYYISPEVLAGNYNELCDMWSCGCILYILLCGYPPFFGDNDQEILRMVQQGDYNFDGEEWDNISSDAKDLIRKLIEKPEKRLTAQEALQHKWLKKFSKANKETSYLRKRNLKSFKAYLKAQKLK